jgi:hypothetical protein
MNSKSNYAYTFGETPKQEESSGILKYQRFAQLSISSIVKAPIRDMIDLWLSMNDIEDFQMRIYTTVREMYTVIKSQDAPASSVGANFKWV